MYIYIFYSTINIAIMGIPTSTTFFTSASNLVPPFASPRYQGLAADEVTYSAMLAAYARSGAWQVARNGGNSLVPSGELT